MIKWTTIRSTLVLALLLASPTTLCRAEDAKPVDEGLYAQLEKVKSAGLVTPPFPFERRDALQDTSGRISTAAQKAYLAYWKRLTPLMTHLTGMETTLKEGLEQKKSITLQWFSAQVLWAGLLQQQVASTLTPADKHYKTYQLLEQTLNNLQDALAFWQARESVGLVYRPTAVNMDEETAYLDTKLRICTESLAELHQLTELYRLLQQGYRQGDR